MKLTKWTPNSSPPKGLTKSMKKNNKKNLLHATSSILLRYEKLRNTDLKIISYVFEHVQMYMFQCLQNTHNTINHTTIYIIITTSWRNRDIYLFVSSLLSIYDKTCKKYDGRVSSMGKLG